MGLFDLIGGGGPVFTTLLRSIIAENVGADQLSSVLYILSAINMILRLGGITFGSWLMQFNATASYLFALTLTSTLLPILGLLPRSAARAPESRSVKDSAEPEEVPLKEMDPEPETSKVHSSDSDRDSTRNVIVRSVNAVITQEQATQANISLKWKKKMAALVYKVTLVPFQNPIFPWFMVITFTNALAMDGNSQVRTWASKRYDWSLTTVGYVLSAESILGVGILLTLPWLGWRGRGSRRGDDSDSRKGLLAPQPSRAGSRAEEIGTALEKEGSLAARRRELLIARVSLGFGATGALILALASARAAFVVGLVVATGAIAFPDAVRAFCTAGFPAEDIQGLFAAATVVQTLSVIVGTPVWGWVYAQGYLGGSLWIGAPFAVVSLLLLCTLGLVFQLKVRRE